jgi:DNA-binding GntR family transcriptional regulator
MKSSATQTGENEMNDQADFTAYLEDAAAEKAAEQASKAEAARIDWAQRNGNDSGFDPYAGCEYED